LRRVQITGLAGLPRQRCAGCILAMQWFRIARAIGFLVIVDPLQGCLDLIEEQIEVGSGEWSVDVWSRHAGYARGVIRVQKV
jgi:hypothetical protein